MHAYIKIEDCHTKEKGMIRVDLESDSIFFNQSHLFRFVHSSFWFLVTFVNEVTKILHNLCLHLARQDEQDGKNRKENHATKVTKIPKDKNMG